MSLLKMDDSSKTFQVDKLPKKLQSFYDRMTAYFSSSQIQKIERYILKRMQEEKKGNGATIFGSSKYNWDNTPLKNLHSTLYKEHDPNADDRDNYIFQQTGFLLGTMMMKVAIEDNDNEWYCLKTNITHHDFETNSYFLREN